MVFGKARNEIQSRIEDGAYLLLNLVDEVNDFFFYKISLIKEEIRTIKEDNKDMDYEEIQSILSPYQQIEEFYNNLCEEAMQMLVSKVYSYAEKHIELILFRIGSSIKKAQKEYRKTHISVEGISDIEKSFYVISNNFNVGISEISEIWRDYKYMHEIRKKIEHHCGDENYSINKDYLISKKDSTCVILKIYIRMKIKNIHRAFFMKRFLI